MLFEGLEDNVDGRHDGGGQSVVGRRADRRVRQNRPYVRAFRLSRHGRQLRRRITCYRDNRRVEVVYLYCETVKSSASTVYV